MRLSVFSPLLSLALGSLVLVACDDGVQNKPVVEQNKEEGGDTSLRTIGEACVLDSQCQSSRCVSSVCAMSTGSGPQCSGDPGPCGDCDPTCQLDGQGMGQPSMFDPSKEGQGVVLDDEGAITLDKGGAFADERYIWISNTAQGTVSKVNTRTFKEEGRYFTGARGADNDPSRTSVNSFGEVFVGNRGGGSITKISSRGASGCRDVNNDGVVRTSSGPDDVLAWGEDDCVSWTRDLCDDGCLVRAVAAQDIALDGDVIKPVVWVGGFNNKRIWKLDGDTGEVLLTTESPVRPYGFAIDKVGNLWVSGPNWGFDDEGRFFGRIDTKRCLTDASCAVEVCDGEGSGDGCVKQRIALDYQPYGLTVDSKQRVWLGGSKLARYTPDAAPGDRLVTVDHGSFVHGIQADDAGFVWGSIWQYSIVGNDIQTTDGGVLQVDAENPRNNTRVGAAASLASKGIAVDFDGRVWSINYITKDATVFEPSETLGQVSVVETVREFEFPYVYSDMTGTQLRYATDQLGIWRKSFFECAPPENYYSTTWKTLKWNADVPDGEHGSIVIRIRAANTNRDLDTTTWHTVTTVNASGPGELDLTALFDQFMWQGAAIVEVEAQLKLVRKPDVTPQPPRLTQLSISRSCPEIFN